MTAHRAPLDLGGERGARSRIDAAAGESDESAVTSEMAWMEDY